MANLVDVLKSKKPAPCNVSDSIANSGTNDSTITDNRNNVGAPDAEPDGAKEYRKSGKIGYIGTKGASAQNFINAPSIKSHNLSGAYNNMGHNNYFDVAKYLTQTEFKMGGRTFNLVHAVNMLYNMCHWAWGGSCKNGAKSNACKSGCSNCTGGVKDGIRAGFNDASVVKDTAEGPCKFDFFLSNLGFVKVYDAYDPNSTIPPKAYPGDIVLQYPDKNKPESASGCSKVKAKSGYHGQMFTGHAWISDFMQADGILSSIYKIRQIYRIPGIEKAWKG